MVIHGRFDILEKIWMLTNLSILHEHVLQPFDLLAFPAGVLVRDSVE